MDWYRVTWPLVRLLDPETAHGLALRAVTLGLPPLPPPPARPRLATTLWGLDFANPLGLAAGFDKDAKAPRQLLKLGFGHVEVGGVTPRPQPGNPKPRLFRLDPDRAVINRMGLNSEGADAVARRLGMAHPKGVVGVNLGANKDSPDRIADYESCFRRLHGLADYFTVNVSSPNTPGLRDLQAVDALRDLFSRLFAARDALTAAGARPTPLLLKLSPDLDPGDAEVIAETALDLGIDGLVIANTTLARPDALLDRQRGEAGGLSGAPLMAPSTALLARLHRHTGGRIPLIGVGGVSSAEDAYAKIQSGASLVQLYTALVFQGPGLVARILTGLDNLLERDGFSSVGDAVGSKAG